MADQLLERLTGCKLEIVCTQATSYTDTACFSLSVHLILAPSLCRLNGLAGTICYLNYFVVYALMFIP
jgi:hypothetical protein